MALADKFREILAEYRADLANMEKRRSPTDGLLGFGRGRGDDPCHDSLDSRTAALLREAQEAPPEEGAALMRELLRAPEEGAWPEHAYLMLIALQRHSLGLISRLSAADAEELAAWQQKTYPFYRRLPVQKDVLRALKRQSGKSEQGARSWKRK